MFSFNTYVRRYGYVVRTYVLLIPRFVRYFIAAEGVIHKSRKANKRTKIFSSRAMAYHMNIMYDLFYLFDKKWSYHELVTDVLKTTALYQINKPLFAI